MLKPSIGERMAPKCVKSIRLSVPIPLNRQPRGANLSSNQAGDGWWLWVENIYKIILPKGGEGLVAPRNASKMQCKKEVVCIQVANMFDQHLSSP